MPYLLVSATAFEIAPTLRHFKDMDEAALPDTLITGVGMLAATWQLAKYISLKKPELIIQAGIAGCFNETVSLGKVYAVTADTPADIGVREKDGWTDIFDMGFAKPSAFPFSNRQLKNPGKELLKKLHLPGARAITVNTITPGKKQSGERKEKYGALLETMEGAALHYVALQENIPFIQLRAVSNYAGERNKKKWMTGLAISNLNAELLRILKLLRPGEGTRP